MTDIDSTVQTIEELTERFQILTREKNEAQTQLTRAETELKIAKDNAKKLYQTDDVAELEALLDKWKQENLGKRAAYQRELDDIEQKLAEVTAEFESEE